MATREIPVGRGTLTLVRLMRTTSTSSLVRVATAVPVVELPPLVLPPLLLLLSLLRRLLASVARTMLRMSLYEVIRSATRVATER